MTVDEDLLDELANAIKCTSGLRRVNEHDALLLLAVIQATFIRDPTQTWWWTSLKGRSNLVQYRDLEGPDLIVQWLGATTPAVMFITDDEPGPWPAVEGTIGDLVSMLGEMRLFEYFLVDPNHQWIVFDTHENQLATAGSIVDYTTTESD